MKVNPSIFKSYDIRGVYPEELNEEAAYEIGRGFVVFSGAKKVVVGRDMRLSSPALFSSLVKGIIDQGAMLFDMGEIPTEVLYFAVGKYDYDAGIMITASHNPKEYNGFKMVKKQGNGFSMIRGIDMVETINRGGFEDPEKKGEAKKIRVLEEYLNYIFSLVDIEKIKPLKVVIDTGNGMAGRVIPFVKNKLPINIISLNPELDGNFPAHPSNVFEKGATDQISQKIKEEKADIGFIFDGDADRIYILDENGEFVRADASLLLLAKYFLEKSPGVAVAYNLICSKAVPEIIEKWGGKPLRTRVGFVNVRNALLENNGLVGGELSGHYCFKDNFYGDSGLLAFLILLQMVSVLGKKVSEVVAELSPYAKGDETNFKIEDKEAVLKKIKESYSSGKQDYLDGVTIEYDDWWFNVRPSNTEPLLRLTIEANTKELLEEKKKELIDFFRE